MTREDAIADIRDNIKPVVGGKSLDMAIEALGQEPCTDAISREDALMALTGEYTDSPIEILPKAIKRINVLPPVNPAEKGDSGKELAWISMFNTLWHITSVLYVARISSERITIARHAEQRCRR